MNWRERYARYRRYGLDPLPADATDAQREAHIAQLRALRKQRQRKVALRSGLGTLALVVAAALLLYWLLMTIGGRDALLRQIVARLPAGSELTWKSAEGPASGPMTLHGVHFAMPRQRDPDCVPTKTASCAMGRIVFDADAVVVDPAIRPLLGKRLRLDALDVRGATLDLPRSDKAVRTAEVARRAAGHRAAAGAAGARDPRRRAEAAAGRRSAGRHPQRARRPGRVERTAARRTPARGQRPRRVHAARRLRAARGLPQRPRRHRGAARAGRTHRATAGAGGER